MLTVCGGLRCAVTESMRLEGEETGRLAPEHASDDCFRLSADRSGWHSLPRMRTPREQHGVAQVCIVARSYRQFVLLFNTANL